jgi:hypothetical protein
LIGVEKVEDLIDSLVYVQREVNGYYNDLDIESFDEDIAFIESGLRDERAILDEIVTTLNELFNIKIRWYNKGFKIKRGDLSRYEICPPHFGMDKSSREYFLLSKILIRSHEKYFLNDGMIQYRFATVEEHMWEIPDFIEENGLIVELRKKNNLGV